MTSSKPETESGDSGRDGSHTIWSPPVAEFRTKRVTAAPWAFSARRRAAPIGPEAPLTRMRIGLMAAAYASTLADWVEPQGSGPTSEDARLYMEPGRCGRERPRSCGNHLGRGHSYRADRPSPRPSTL